MLVNSYQKSDIYVSIIVFIVIYAITTVLMIKMSMIPDNMIKNILVTIILFSIFYTLNKYITLTLSYQN
jgi:hypothetical protein